MSEFVTKTSLLACLMDTEEMREFISKQDISYEVILYKPCHTHEETQDLINFCSYEIRHLMYPYIVIETLPSRIIIDNELNKMIITTKDDYEATFDDFLKKYGEEYIHHVDVHNTDKKTFVFSLLVVVKSKDGIIRKYVPGKHRALFVNNDNVETKMCSGSSPLS